MTAIAERAETLRNQAAELQRQAELIEEIPDEADALRRAIRRQHDLDHDSGYAVCDDPICRAAQE